MSSITEALTNSPFYLGVVQMLFNFFLNCDQDDVVEGRFIKLADVTSLEEPEFWMAGG